MITLNNILPLQIFFLISLVVINYIAIHVTVGQIRALERKLKRIEISLATFQERYWQQHDLIIALVERCKVE